jgi:hypothetical protein
VEFIEYSSLILTFLTIMLAWRFSDWRNWKKYYPSILFTIALNLVITLLTYNHSLWYFHGTLLLSNHVLADLWMKFFIYPPMILTYLSLYPFKERFSKQVGYIVIWTLIWGGIEGYYVLVELITHHYGWNMWWSFLIWVLMFSGIRLHHTRPLLTWFLCFLITVFMIIHFDIPITELK